MYIYFCGTDRVPVKETDTAVFFTAISEALGGLKLLKTVYDIPA
jgi:hypothetical protein